MTSRLNSLRALGIETPSQAYLLESKRLQIKVIFYLFINIIIENTKHSKDSQFVRYYQEYANQFQVFVSTEVVMCSYEGIRSSDKILSQLLVRD